MCMQTHCIHHTHQLLLYLDVGVQARIQVFFMALCNNVDQYSVDTDQQQWFYSIAFIVK